MHAWTIGGALAMGSGIWAMHFVGMLAFRLPIAIGYDVPITLLSLLLPVLVSGIALWRVSRPQISWPSLLRSGLLMGLGINTMHYTGMAALRMTPAIVYEPVMFTASLLIAIVASTGAMWLGFRLRNNISNPWLGRLGAAVVFGCAIAGMHYTGMAAASFPAGSICMAATSGVSQDGLAIMVVIATLGILTVALLASAFDASLERHSRQLALTQAAAEERQALLLREREARSQAESVSALRDEFLATLSHELRTPLNAVLGWAVLLQRGSHDAATRQRALEAIERNARAQAKLIDDLLDMSRTIAGKVRLEVQEVHPAAIIEAAIDTVRPAALAKRITLTATLAGAGTITGDPDRLQQVMWNLLSNAVKFTPADGSVQVSLQQDESDLVIRVSDSGIGIAPEFLPHVFDRFRQADASTTRRHGGLGLGLAIARQLVEMQGGSIDVESEGLGRGASFAVRLPLRRASPAAADTTPGAVPPSPRAAAEFAAEDLAGMRVLVVDDMADTLDLTAQMLGSRGAHTVLACGAEQALVILGTESFDAVVSDIAMPDMDGYEFMRRARASGLAVPAIALTAFSRPEDRERALQAGFDGLIAKPLEVGALAAAIAARRCVSV